MAKDGTSINSSESFLMKVDESYRITLPQPLAKRIGWITGEKAHSGWLLVIHSGRCQLLSAAEVDEDPDLRFLLDIGTAETAAPTARSVESQSEASIASAFRLLPVEIRPRGRAWRMLLPPLIAAIMQVSPGRSEIIAFFVQGRTELWTIETVKAAMSTPLDEIG
jgi:hypothetical protein